MEKRLLLAVALSVGFLLLWTWLFTPPPPHPGAPSGAAGTQAPGPSGPAGVSTGAASGGATGSGPGVTAPSLAGVGGVEGAARRPDLWRLKKYLDDHGHPLELVSQAGRTSDHLPLQFLLEDPETTRRLKDALYTVTRKEAAEDGRTITTIAFAFGDGAGLQATKSLRVDHASYITEVEVAAAVAARAVEPSLVWGVGFGPHNGLENGRYSDTAHAVVNLGGRVTRLDPTKMKPEQLPAIERGPVVWAGLEDRYFAAVLVPQAPADGTPAAGGEARVESVRLVEDGREHFFPSFALAVAGASRYHLFVGPKDYDVLKGFRLGLERLLDFGMFTVIALPLFYALKFIDRYVGNFGWAIVILTVVIRLIFFPLMHRSQVKMRAMQEKMKRIQPKLKAMKERYHRLERKEAEKGNARARHQLRQKMNEEMMELYKEEGINPLGSMSGCLPLLLQLPILYAFYAILTIAIELRKAPFMFWIGDLSQKDPYFVTPIVMGVTMLVQQMMTSSTIADPAQRRMMYLMPIMFTYFFISLPSGLVLYWLTSNLLGIGQQYLINKEVDAARDTA